MTLAITSTFQTDPRFFPRPARSRGVRWLPNPALWLERRRTRQQLAALDDRMLADIGLTREQRRMECAKPFWL
jgi:uncharacterized protein YjiS (DUF1127 family)